MLATNNTQSSLAAALEEAINLAEDQGYQNRIEHLIANDQDVRATVEGFWSYGRGWRWRLTLPLPTSPLYGPRTQVVTFYRRDRVIAGLLHRGFTRYISTTARNGRWEAISFCLLSTRGQAE